MKQKSLAGCDFELNQKRRSFRYEVFSN